MSRGGEIIRRNRERQGWSLRVVARLTGVSSATLSRIETGSRMPSVNEIREIAHVLCLDQSRLIEIFDEERKYRERSNTLLSSGGFFDIVRTLEEFIRTAETLRMNGLPVEAIANTRQAMGMIKGHLKSGTREEQRALHRLLVMALITHTMAYTMVLSRDNMRHNKKIDKRLQEIRELRHHLHERDTPYRDMALMLPALVNYLRGEWAASTRWISRNLDRVEQPYMRGMGLRDRLIIAGKTQDLSTYQAVIRQADRMTEQGLLKRIDQARIWEGRAYAAVDLKLSEPGKDVQQAELLYQEAAFEGEQRPSIQAQIIRTTTKWLVSQKRINEERVLATAKRGVSIFRNGRFDRHMEQMIDFLMKTEQPQLQEFCLSL